MQLLSFLFGRYGDRIPRTPFGRLVCLTWILLGVIMVTCFNSTMTTLLTARILDKEVNLYGTKVCINFYTIVFIFLIKNKTNTWRKFFSFCYIELPVLNKKHFWNQVCKRAVKKNASWENSEKPYSKAYQLIYTHQIKDDKLLPAWPLRWLPLSLFETSSIIDSFLEHP